MNAQEHDYLTYWNRAKPLMTLKLEHIRRLLAEKTAFGLSEIVEGGDEEFRMSLDLVRPDDIVVLSMDFTLLDSAVNGGASGAVAVSLSAIGYNALALGGYMPRGYTSDAFTDDVVEMQARIERLDAAEFARYVCDEALTNTTLLRELSEAS
ncbi:hypothetical protein LJR034_009213 [Caballeronia sp. LjRoot34]|uniref:hypothetical protein n=1 Tax=Caballeronia sp. LjRoot34 TaxID=3342325 RepID=UPI003ED0F727